MDPQQIRELLKIIKRSGLEEVKIKTNDLLIEIRAHSRPLIGPHSPSPQVPPPASLPTPTTSPIPPTIPEEQGSISEDLIPVKAQMVGTFYAASSPDEEPFIKVGDKIKVGQTLCIIEAMKLFNEIESEVAGVVAEIRVEDATPVEFDQVLFLIRPG
ncbi:MAG: acetyl-CoA carboxylase biotin carboxyl carrier protein [Cytophagales bacterium]|nr:acetyl-CoA carboxylase biotin carboxyl carrier protein [Cytophagales bacterium]